MKWVRFADPVIADDSMLLPSPKLCKYDFIVLKCNKNIIFKGFGIYASDQEVDLKVRISWIVDTKDTGSQDLTLPYNSRCHTHNWHTIDFEERGEVYLQLQRGQQVELRVQALNEESRSTYYGLNSIEKNKKKYQKSACLYEDFEVIDSKKKQSSSRDFGQFPFVLYSYS